jgi:mannose-1-phosphate guanylyltransferase
MAGGSGTRFWPRSRDKKPKQFLNVFGNETLIQNTINRFLPLAHRDNIYVISKHLHQEEILKQNLTIDNSNILYEPVGKNTLPCIGLAALFIKRKNPDAIIVVTPSDHLVGDLPLFRETIMSACNVAAENDGIVTIGINPTFPATGFGYIQLANKVRSGTEIDAYKVKSFVEKPDSETAEKYLASEEYLWNSGMFVFKCSALWDAIEKFTPALFDSLKEIDKYIDTPQFYEQLSLLYKSIDSVSIDYGIMEKADNTFVVKGDFQWNDLGGWKQVYDLSEKDSAGNATSGNVVLMDTGNSYVYSQNGLVALMGVRDLLVIQHENATLVMKIDESENIKNLVGFLKNKGLDEFI